MNPTQPTHTWRNWQDPAAHDKTQEPNTLTTPLATTNALPQSVPFTSATDPPSAPGPPGGVPPLEHTLAGQPVSSATLPLPQDSPAVPDSPPFSPPSIPSPSKPDHDPPLSTTDPVSAPSPFTYHLPSLPPFFQFTPSNLSAASSVASHSAASATPPLAFFPSFFSTEKRKLETQPSVPPPPAHSSQSHPANVHPGRDEGEEEPLHESVPLLHDHPFSNQEGIQTLLKDIPFFFKTNDSIWASLYLLGIFSLFLLGLRAWFLSNNPLPFPNTPIPTSIVVSILVKHSLPVFVAAFCLSFLLGALWILLLGAFVVPIVWATFLFVPLASMGLAVWALVCLLVTTPSGTVQALLGTVFMGSVLVGTRTALRLFLHPRDVQMCVRFFQLATQVLRTQGLALFFLAWTLLAAYLVAATLLFLAMAAGLGGGAAWTLAAALFVWTTRLFAVLHQMGVACMVHHGYFAQTPAPWRRALRRVLLVLFGTACRASLPALPQWRRRGAPRALVPIFCALAGHAYAPAAAQHLPALLDPSHAAHARAHLARVQQVLRGCTLLVCAPLVVGALLPLPPSWEVTPLVLGLLATFAWGCFRAWQDVLLHVLHTLHLCYHIDLHNHTCHSQMTHDVFEAASTP